MLPEFPPTPHDWSVQRFLGAFVRYAPAILGAALLLSLLTYVTLARQTPRYQPRPGAPPRAKMQYIGMGSSSDLAAAILKKFEREKYHESIHR